MAVSTFAVTHGDIRAHYFPSMADFGGGTKPTSTTVGQMIAAEAARLAGALFGEGVTAATISADAGATYPVAYALCQHAIRLGSAIRVMEAIAGAGVVPEFWRKELEMFYSDLSERGYVALADAPAPSQLSDGPRWHGDNHSLESGDNELLSDISPKFRISDDL